MEFNEPFFRLYIEKSSDQWLSQIKEKIASSRAIWDA